MHEGKINSDNYSARPAMVHKTDLLDRFSKRKNSPRITSHDLYGHEAAAGPSSLHSTQSQSYLAFLGDQISSLVKSHEEIKKSRN